MIVCRISSFVRFLLGVLVCLVTRNNQSNFVLAVVYDNPEVQYTIFLQINDIVEIGEDVSVTIENGGIVSPRSGGTASTAVNVGRIGNSISQGATLTIVSGASIIGPRANFGWDAVLVNFGNTFTMTGGTLQGGTSTASFASDTGHALQVFGSATISGGTLIPGNRGSAIFVRFFADVTISGGTIDGDIKLSGSGISDSSVLITGGNFKENSIWALGGQGVISVTGCIMFDPDCGEAFCPLTGTLGDGTPISVRVQDDNPGGSIALLSTCAPTASPAPSDSPSAMPTTAFPSAMPSSKPTLSPSAQPSSPPTPSPSAKPSSSPSAKPSTLPSATPSNLPSFTPSVFPSTLPSSSPSSLPSVVPSSSPSVIPSASPSFAPSALPSALPSDLPSSLPSQSPSAVASASPSLLPSATPSNLPTLAPTTTPNSNNGRSANPANSHATRCCSRMTSIWGIIFSFIAGEMMVQFM